MNDTELKPCPWCDKIPEIKKDWYYDPKEDGEYYVICCNENCNVQPDTITFSSKKEAINAWNDRHGG